MYNDKEIKDTNRPQRRSNFTRNDKEEESININVIGAASSTITVLKRNEEERGKLYNVYEISVPSKSKPNVDRTKQARKETNKLRVPDISRRLNAPLKDDIHENERSKKKESFQDRYEDDTEFESDGTEDKDSTMGLYRLKRDYNTFAFHTLSEKGKQPINKFSLSENSPTSSLGDFSNTSSLDLKEPLLNIPKENRKVTFLTTDANSENRKPLNEPTIETQIKPKYLKPETKMTNNLKPTIIKPSDNLSDITKWHDDLEDSSTDSEFSSFFSSDTSLIPQFNKPEEKKPNSILSTTRRYERKYTKFERKITHSSLKPTKLEPTKRFPISESVDDLSDITKWHDDLGDSSLESFNSPYRPSCNSLTHFPDILPEVNKLFAEPFGEKSTLAYSREDDNEKPFDTTSVEEKHMSYTDNTLDTLARINSISSFEEPEEKDNFDNLGQSSLKINKPPKETEVPKTNDEKPSLKNYIQIKPQEDYFDDHLPYLQKKPSNLKPKDSDTFLDKYPILPTLSDSGRFSTISGTYFDKNIPYLGKTPRKNKDLDEFSYSTIPDQISDTSGQDSRKSFETYFDEHLPFLDIKPDKIESKNEIVQPTSLEKSPDQISDLGSQLSDKSSGKYFSKLLSYLGKKPDREEKISTDSKGSKGSSISSGKYFNKNIADLFKKPNKEEIISTDNKGSKESSINSGKYVNENMPYLTNTADKEENILSLGDISISSDENKPLKKHTIVVTDEVKIMPYLEQSQERFSDSESDDSKRSDYEERASIVKKFEPEYEEIPDERIQDKNDQRIMMGEIDGTNPFDSDGVETIPFDSDGVETTNYDDDSIFDSDPSNTNIYSENGKRQTLVNDVQRNSSDERISNVTIPPYQEQEGPRRTTISSRPQSVFWSNEVPINDNNNLERTSIPRNSRFDHDLHPGNVFQLLPLKATTNHNVFVPDRDRVGSLENKPGKISIVEERDQAKRTRYPYRDNSVVSEGPTKYKETIPRRNTYNDGYRTPEYNVPQIERRSVNYPTYKDKNTMTDSSYNPLNNQDELWFGTIKSQTYGPGDIDNTNRNDRPSLYKPRDSSVRPSERQSPWNDDRRGPSIPGRKSNKYLENRPSSVISLPEKENIILNKKSLKSADDATPPVTDKKKTKKKRFKSLQLPTSKPQEAPNFEVVGTALLSRKPIPRREPPEDLNKDLGCSLKIKGSKIDAICNLYFDPRLIDLLLDQLGFIGGKIRRRRDKKKRKADKELYLSESSSSTLMK